MSHRRNRSPRLILTVAVVLVTLGGNFRPPLATAQTPAPASTCGTAGGVIVYQQLHLQRGTPSGVLSVASDLVIATAAGKERRRFPMPGVAISRVIPMLTGCRTLVTTDANRSFALDAAQGTLTPLALPAGIDPYPSFQWRRGRDGGRYAILGGTGGSSLVLVDLVQATVADLSGILADLAGKSLFADSVRILPSDDTLLIESGNDLWLVPTADPRKARRVSQTVAPFSDAFSEDGAWLLYSESTRDGDNQVVRERVDGTRRSVIATGPRITRGLFVPGQAANQIIVRTRTRVSLVTVEPRSETVVASLPAAASGLSYLAPDGRHVLVGSYPTNQLTAWALVDLATGGVTALPSLDNLDLRSNAPSLRWVLFSNSDFFDIGAAHPLLISLDLQTGAAHLVIASNNGERRLNQISVTSADGHFTLLTITPIDKGGYPQPWLVNADTGAVRQLAEFGGGSFSPDGSQIVLASRRPAELPDKTRLTLVPTAGGDGKPFVDAGTAPVWLPVTTGS